MRVRPNSSIRSLAALAVASALAASVACGGGSGGGATSSAPPPEAPAAASAAAPAGPAGDAIPAAAIAEAEQIFATRCTACHGPLGRGDGPASAGLAPPPRNFALPDWQASVTDEHIETIVKYGGAAVGKAATMPSNPDLIAKPDVVKALRAHVRGLKQQ